MGAHFKHTSLEQAGLADIYEKVAAGTRLSFADGVRLYTCPDINLVGYLANIPRERLHGNAAYYNVNLHINYSNICALECAFCAFGKKPKDEDAYEYTLAQMVHQAAEAQRQGCTELHIVGGLHPRWTFYFYIQLLAEIKRAAPKLHLKCFTAVEIEHLATRARLGISETLTELMDAGLGSVSGGGAEIFAWRARKLLCEPKQDAEHWLRVHRAAHALGLKSNCTMLYGSVETMEERVDHLLQLRALQDDSGGFQCMIPLSFHPENTALSHLPKPSVLDDLRNLAISRLMLDNIPHIKAYWIMQGIDVAQTSLAYGVDDLDGTVRRERIYHMAGAKTPQHVTEDDLRRLIKEAGRVPVERNSVYRRVERGGDTENWKLGAPVMEAACL